MAKCLGLYIEDNIIKYAKVSKEREDIKVEAFGVEFYDKLDKAIDKVIEETYSQKTPISINLKGENYNYFRVFSLLSKADLQKAIKTEFDTYCEENGYNPNVFETRYSIVDEKDERDRLKVIHVFENKLEMNKTTQQLGGYKLTTLTPLPIALPNLIGKDDFLTKENCLIVNIEGTTTITKVVDNSINEIIKLDEGSGEFLTKINLKENSYSKAYEICKNTTIYTSSGRDLQTQESNEYIEDIMPTLYSIVSSTKKIITDSLDKIDKVYLTGSGAMINNIDIYFQEYLGETTCEILRPYFIQNTGDMNVKDFEEVNSAISLGLMGVGEGVQGMNFKSKSFGDGLPSWLTADIGSGIFKSELPDLKDAVRNDLGEPFDKAETILVRIAVVVFLIVAIYSGFSALLSSQMDKKQTEAEAQKMDTMQQIMLAKTDNEKLKSRTDDYQDLIDDIEAENEKTADKQQSRNQIPDLMNQLMYILPENASFTKIENTSGKHIVIGAKSAKYEQLGYLAAKIKQDGILTNVTSTGGNKDGKFVIVQIEGELP